ncbi:MAG: NUDIX domain-containing protein [Balneola sp.]
MKNKKIEAAGGIVFRRTEKDQTEVLMIFRNGFWDIPKGKREKGESIEMCARREVMEEVGADSLPLITSELVSSKHSYNQKGKIYHKTTYWFTMNFEIPQSFTPEISEGIELVEWVEIDKAIGKVGFENLVPVLEDFKVKLRDIKKA